MLHALWPSTEEIEELSILSLSIFLLSLTHGLTPVLNKRAYFFISTFPPFCFSPNFESSSHAKGQLLYTVSCSDYYPAAPAHSSCFCITAATVRVDKLSRDLSLSWSTGLPGDGVCARQGSLIKRKAASGVWKSAASCSFFVIFRYPQKETWEGKSDERKKRWTLNSYRFSHCPSMKIVHHILTQRYVLSV